MDNINDIISSLSADDIEMLKGVASSILGDDAQAPQSNMSDKVNTRNTTNTTNTANALSAVNNSSGLANMLGSGNPLGSLGLNQDDFKMMMKAKTIIDKMNSASSKNADLINALKPHLNESSRQKADQAIRILKLFEVLPYLKELF
ncbi:MAG: hypothetical protein ACLUFN_10895 [Eubacterium sp.]